MSTKIPTVRKMSFLSLLPQLAFGTILCIVFSIITKEIRSGCMLGCAMYLIVSRGTKAIFLKHHRKGMRLLKKYEFENAIDEFELSVEFFQKHPLIDKFRYILMLDSSKFAYTEMALVNIAFCYAILKEFDTALDYYRKTLSLFRTILSQ